MRSTEYIFKSAPYPVYWAGWRTDTLELQRAGWEMEASQDARRQTLTVAFWHPQMRMEALAAPVVVDRWHDILRDPRSDIRPPLQIRQAGTRGHLTYILPPEVVSMSFEPIDAQMEVQERRFSSMEDLNLFNPKRTKGDEVLYDVADMSVVEHLEEVIRMQACKQAELRKRFLVGEGEELPARASRARPRATLVAVQAA